MESSTILLVFEVSVVLLLANSFLYLSKKIKLPYSILLVILGMLISIVRQNLGIFSHLNLDSEILYFVFLPILLFESAFHIDFRSFKKDFSLILLLSTFGVLVASLVTGFLVSYFLNIPASIALIFAALISSTDPIAVISIFKDLGVSKRLIQLIDSESMLNDGTSIILTRTITSFIAIGFAGESIVSGIGNFFYVILGSVLFGGGIGFLLTQIIRKIRNDFFIEFTITLACSFLIFILAEEIIKVSGIIAVVVAGITLGNYGRDDFSPKVQTLLNDIWEYFAFIANSLVFFLIGLSLQIDLLASVWPTILLLYLIVTFGRIVSVYPITIIYNLTNPKNAVPAEWMHIINWGGLRGALPIAAILFLEGLLGPNTFLLDEFGGRLETYMVGVVLLSLLINGLTIKPLIKLLSLDKVTLQEQIETGLMKTYVLNQSLKKIRQLEKTGHSLGQRKFLSKKISQAFNQTIRHLKQLFEANPFETAKVLYAHSFKIERRVFINLYNQGVISKKILNKLEKKLVEGLDLINDNVLPSEFCRNEVMLRLSKDAKKDFDLQDLYMYRKAREFANLEVLEELSAFNNIPALNDLVSGVTKTYQGFYHKNYNTCFNLETKYCEQVRKFEEDIYFCELMAAEEDIIHQLESGGRVSPTLAKDLQKELLLGKGVV